MIELLLITLSLSAASAETRAAFRGAGDGISPDECGSCASLEEDGDQPDMETSREDAKPQPAFPDLPRAITSFGAARLADAVYVYGGHHGKAHHYYDEGQSGELLRLNLTRPAKWEVVATGPRLQGLALVSHHGKLYRVGGFTARNKEDEEKDLWSVADFTRFDPQTGTWEKLPSMPEPRSSFDAVVAGDTLYVIGGWAMQGSKDADWLESAYTIDLSHDSPTWRALPQPPFERRALSVGTLDGKVYAIGGMQPDGKVTKRTAVFDPSAGEWSQGPELPGEDMEGFGTACCAAGGRLYVSTSSGKVLRLSADGQAWDAAGKLRDGRFFHQMLPIGERQLMVLGGASMQTGKFSDVEPIQVP